MDVSVIIPTYNEADNIVVVLTKLREIFSSVSYQCECIVMDDSSPDKTAQLAQDFFRQWGGGKAVVRTQNRGLAPAVIEGFLHAQGNVMVVIDADLSHPPEVVPSLVSPLLNKEAQVAFASRYRPGGGVSGWPLHRQFISRVAASFGRVLFPHVTDPASGFFALTKSVVEKAPLDAKGFKIGLDILAHGNYQRVVEVPYVFTDRQRGQSKLSSRTVFDYLAQLFAIFIQRLRKSR